jgi:hypothetical protein
LTGPASPLVSGAVIEHGPVLAQVMPVAGDKWPLSAAWILTLTAFFDRKLIAIFPSVRNELIPKQPHSSCGFEAFLFI